MTHLLALLGVVSISFSAIFVRLAGVSPVTAAFFRAAYALPALGVVLALSRGSSRSLRERTLAFCSGLLLALDLAFWHLSIAQIGAGLATVLANVQVVFVAGVAWALWGERPTFKTVVIVAGVFGGVVLTSGLNRPDAYGASPIAGVVAGVIAGASYAGFLLMFRASNRALAPTAGPLFDATLGTAVGALAMGVFDPRFSFVPAFPAHGWLIAMALVAQVIGWLFIAGALPRLPAVETSVLLLAQPVFTLAWGATLFDEHLSVLQWVGVAMILGGVATAMGKSELRS